MNSISLNSVFFELIVEINKLRDVAPGCRWYKFGSAVSSKAMVSDIDLLVVYPASSDCNKIRASLAGVCNCYPVHLLLMSEIEEMEMNFINNEGAIELPVGS